MNLPTKELFESSQQDVFEIAFEDGSPKLCNIAEINTSQAPMVEQNTPQFSVIFSSSETEVYEQGVYPVSHPELGTFELFLVPVYGDDKGVHYEAIFT